MMWKQKKKNSEEQIFSETYQCAPLAIYLYVAKVRTKLFTEPSLDTLPHKKYIDIVHNFNLLGIALFPDH